MSERIEPAVPDRAALALKIIRTAGLVAAALSAALLVAPGVYLLVAWLFLSGFRDLVAGFRLGPPSPPRAVDVANDARNAAELAGLFRQSLLLIGLGAAALAVGLVVARGASRATPRPNPGISARND